jgi:hypothetical protein
MAGTVPLLDEKFERVGEGVIDSRKRILLTKAVEILRDVLGEEPEETHFVIACNKAGQILLSPAVTIPLHEVWLYKNKAALDSVLEGIEDAKRGKVKRIGSFAKYADDKID